MQSKLITLNKKDQTSRWLLTTLLITSAITLPLGIYQRYKSGSNYLPVHVKLQQHKLPKAHTDSEFTVYTESPHGTLGALDQSKLDKSEFISPYSRPVSGILIACNQNYSLKPEDVYVTSGNFSTEPVYALETLNVIEVSRDRLPISADRVYAIQVQPLRSSLSNTASKTINWQGDISLFVPPIFQTLLLVTAIACITPALQTIKGKEITQDQQHITIERLTKKVLALFFFCIAALQLLSQIRSFLPAQDARQYAIGCSATLAVIGSAHILRGITKKQTRPQTIFTAATCILLITALKYYWIYGSANPQINDYAIYLRNAMQMAAGNWRSLASNAPLAQPYVTRAFPYYYPIALLPGDFMALFPLVNLLTQTLTILLSFVATARSIGLRAATVSLPFLGSFPDQWFSISTVSHDVPSLCLLAFITLCYVFRTELVQRMADSNKNLPRHLALLLPLSIVIGCVSGVLDVQRSYGPILLCSFLIMFFFDLFILRLLHPKDIAIKWPLVVLASLSAILTITCFRFTSSQIVSMVTSRTGQLGSVSSLAYISSVDSSTRAKFNEMAPWAHTYFPSVPNNLRLTLGLKRLLHEKFVKSNQLVMQVFKKIEELSGFDYALFHAVSNPHEKLIWEDRIPWFEAKRAYCCSMGCVLLLFIMVRIPLLSRIRLDKGELFPIVFSITAYFILLLLSESVAIYDVFLFYVFSLSTGLILSLERPARQREIQSTKILCISTAGPIIVLGFLIYGYSLLGSVIPTSLLPFNAISNVRATSPQTEIPYCLPPQIETDGVSVQLRPEPVSSGIYREGYWTEVNFECQTSPGTLSFFLTTSQRARKQTDQDTWTNSPVVASLKIDGREVFSGNIAELSSVRFLSFPGIGMSSTSSRNISLRMHFSETTRFPDPNDIPTIAFEYPFTANH